MFIYTMSMSTMSGRGCVAFRGGEKDGTEEGGMGEVAWLRGGRKPKVL